MPYPEPMVAPMRAEVVQMGVTELKTADDVRRSFENAEGTALYFINSVCGCAAGSARPGLGQSLAGEARPDHLYTVFAGQDTDATAALREKIVGVPPSSPFFALFKDGDLAGVVERHQIQGLSAEQLGSGLAEMYGQLAAL